MFCHHRMPALLAGSLTFRPYCKCFAARMLAVVSPGCRAGAAAAVSLSVRTLSNRIATVSPDRNSQTATVRPDPRCRAAGVSLAVGALPSAAAAASEWDVPSIGTVQLSNAVSLGRHTRSLNPLATGNASRAGETATSLL